MSLGVLYEKGARESSEEYRIMSHTAKINGYRIAYNKIGHGPKKAVLVHGWGASKAWWQTVANAQPYHPHKFQF